MILVKNLPYCNPGIVGVARTILSIFLLLSFLCTKSNADDTLPYNLGPNDRILIKVWDIRNGEPYQWTALNGEFTVASEGTISLPIVGEVTAGGKTVKQVAEELSSRLQIKVGLSSKPEASVQVVKYRSFFIMGAVQKPGMYEFIPGLTVLQAISIAEGFSRNGLSQTLSLNRDLISNRGDARSLSSELLSLIGRQARLIAETTDAREIVFPPDLLKNTSATDARTIIKDESALFTNRREALSAQLISLDQSKTVLRSQIAALTEKEASVNRQLDLARADVNQVNDLVSRGLGVTTRKLSAEQNVVAFESGRLDIQIALLKAKQDLSQADRDVLDLTSKFKTSALADLAELRTKINGLRERINSANSINRYINAAVLEDQTSMQFDKVNYSVARSPLRDPLVVKASDNLQPGDVLQVIISNTEAEAGPG
jgi:protein involved in polysaccharide export with SLBB domain